MSRNLRGKAKGPRMLKEILRLREMGLSKRKIAKALNCSRNTVDKYLNGADRNSLSASVYMAPWAIDIDWSRINEDVNKGVPLRECWEDLTAWNENIKDVPYVSFWREYRRRHPNIPLEMHKIHPPGERCEIDYKGDSPGLGYVDKASGEFIPCRLYGAVLCFSQLFFPRATHTEKQVDLLGSTSAAYEYFGGVPSTSVIDNAKVCVNKAHRYDPDINKEFSHFCAHYGTAPIATRPRSPKDKNLIENALGVFWRWAQRRVRSRTVFSLGELNELLCDIADEFNGRIQRKYGMSRKQKFDHGEQEKLLPLPNEIYRVGEWKKAKLHPDCHIQVGYCFYSAPYHLRGQELEVRLTKALVEVFHNLERVACHLRFPPRCRGNYTTKKEHLPEAHLAVREATPQAVIDEAAEVGLATEFIVRRLINEATHPLMYLRRVQGILRLRRRYSKAALEQACDKVKDLGNLTPRLHDIEDIIKTNINPKSATVLPLRKENRFLRGQDSWSLSNQNRGESRECYRCYNEPTHRPQTERNEGITQYTPESG